MVILEFWKSRWLHIEIETSSFSPLFNVQLATRPLHSKPTNRCRMFAHKTFCIFL